jgi:hypothetical protein
MIKKKISPEKIAKKFACLTQNTVKILQNLINKIGF